MGPDASTNPFLVETPSRKVALRHLLSYLSGIDHEANPLIDERQAHLGEEPRKEYHPRRLLAPEGFSTLLRVDLLDLFFTPSFPSDSVPTALRRDAEMHSIPAGIRASMIFAPVNHSSAVLVVEEGISFSGVPNNTVTWNGMLNAVWAVIPRGR
ncbi:hypothetical protein K504DRAFT_498455 [Pleomassaria siparia CBS 279.74]|uniref:Uncharacterized protein n=1 Tax=Pleomassaria siparia CBS 279.74 TaxID=1314801 RepID=A0A6G1KLH1_9PLEO|nr:hypothetical protein K504DRAFT_498455 [Pleomassaria siparia CBS 279.74]